MPRFSFENDDIPYHAVDAPPAEPPRYQPPDAQPDNNFSRLRSQRRYSNQRGAPQPAADSAQGIGAPPPPPHRDSSGRVWGQELGYTNSRVSNVTAGADNFGEQAQGGMTGLALGVADANARESGLEAMRHTQGYEPRDLPEYEESPYTRPPHGQDISQTSLTPLGAAAFPLGHGDASPSMHSSVSGMSRSNASLQDPYSDSVYYNRHSRNMNPNMEFDPNSIEDDGDDGLEYRQRNQRGSMLNSSQNGDRGTGTGAGAGAAAAGGVMGTLGGLVGRTVSGNSPQYNPVENPHTAYNGPNDYDLGRQEKSEWLQQEKTGRKKVAWIVGAVVALIIMGAIAGGVAGGVLSRGHSKSSSTGQSASSDTSSNGDLNIDSAEIKKLMGNTNLHKVFPGIDYTPMNTQYPDCLNNPPSQNNVTRDLAVLSQLTNIIRLYGTDCNQTQMLLHSIDALNMNGTIKVWLGVWQDTNATTNARQLAQMYEVLDTYGPASFMGVIVGNEVLYREDMTETELGDVITEVRNNLTSRGMTDLAIASSDLGDNWSSAPSLVELVDYVMANIHPFFAGVPASRASAWTNNFFDTHDVTLKSNSSKAIISETGWPSTGGTDCGTDTITDCPNAAVAGITEMNTFMDDFVCSSLDNGTNYFWFEAFDEPWKIVYDTTGKEWEDKWGLMDVNRKLKSGVTIPDCGGKTVAAA